MKKWWILLFVMVILFTGYRFVSAEKPSGVHNIQITDRGIAPATITVKLDSVVKIKVTNQGTQKHNLVIPDYYIFTQNLNVGETTDAEFTANKAGSFPYYSDAPGSPEPGIKGVLIVK